MCYKILLCILTIHLAILFKFGLNEEIIVVEGQVAILPCESTLSSRNTSAETTLLRWFHNRYHKPLYTLDVRHVNQQSKSFRWSDNNARHFPSPDYEGRLYLELNSEIPTLRIDPVLFDDHGRYTCQVDFRTSRSVSSYTDLRVIIPPKGVVIRDQEDRKVEGVIGPFNLGETLIITCEALGGDPLPLLSWSGTYDNSTGAYHQITTNTTSTIKIPRLQRNDQWTHFTCTARNSNLTLAKSSTVTVEINLPPLDIKMEKNFLEPLSAGEEVTFTCKSFGSHPRAHIRWCLNGQSVTSKDVVAEKGNLTISYHQRRSSSQDDGKTLECIVTNPNIPSFILKQTYTINVHYKPQIMMDIQASSNSITEGRNVTIICNIRSNPVASRTFWLFQDEKILNSPNVLSEGANLFIQGIKRTDAGNYSCQASNIKGTSRAAIQVNVEYAPVCQDIEISAKHRIKHNKDVANVTCNLSSNPGNVTFYWMTRNSSSNHSWSTGQDSYTLLELDENLFEMFCWGENVVGLQKSACTFSFDDTKKAGQDVIFVISFVALLCFIIFLAFFRKLCERDRKDPEVESNEVIGLKDGGCGQMINNCVKSKGTSTKNECLTNLLSSDYSKIMIKNKNSSTIPDRISKVKMRQESEEMKVLLRYTKSEKPRRIRSSQF